MRIIFLLVLILFAIAFAAITLFYFIFKIIANFKPSQNSLSEDLAKLKHDIAEWSNGLVPWNEEEMELLSLNQEQQSYQKRFGTKAKGIYTTIFHEPLLAYNYKKYSGGKQAVLFAKTSHREFSYVVKKEGTLVFIDNKKIGVLKNGALYGQQNKQIAKINQGENETLNSSIVINDREVAGLINPTEIDKVNPRAFSFVEKMDNKEEAVFLSLAILELVQREVA